MNRTLLGGIAAIMIAVTLPASAAIAATGPCCLSDCSCQQLTLEACTAQGGVYLGDGLLCAPNPCSCPPGACCYTDQVCVVDTRAACQGGGGTFLGEFATCAPNPCPPPPPTTGACCLNLPRFGPICWPATPSFCARIPIGRFLGLGVPCAPGTCAHTEARPTDALEGAGACCTPMESCLLLVEEDCRALEGEFLGRGSSCDLGCAGGGATTEESWGSIKSRYRP